MARYREKDSTDLAWNRIRRAITRALDTEIQNRREEVLNELLVRAWDEYTEALKAGTVIELEQKYRPLITAIVHDVVVGEEIPRADLGQNKDA